MKNFDTMPLRACAHCQMQTYPTFQYDGVCFNCHHMFGWDVYGFTEEDLEDDE